LILLAGTMNKTRPKVKTNGFTHFNSDGYVKDKSLRVISKDNIRYLKVKDQTTTQNPTQISRQKINQIKQKAHEKLDTAETQKDTEKLNELIQRRAERMKRLGSGSKNEDIEAEKNQKRRELESKARRAKLAEEQEVKEMNRHINEAQCFYIRDMQVEDNKRLRQQRKAEEILLDELMAKESSKTAAIEEEKEKKIQAQKPINAAMLVNQIKERENKRILDQESKIAENIKLNETFKAENEQRAIEKVNQRKEQAIARLKWEQENENIKMMHRQQQEMERLEDMKVQREAAERDQRIAQLEEEARLRKAAKEREIAMLRMKHEKASNDMADRDALLARRAQERNERECRRKELEAARKKADQVKQLQAERLAQLEEKKRQKVLQKNQNRQELNKLLSVQREQDQAELDKIKRNHQLRTEHSQALRRQIETKEQELVEAHNAKIKDGRKQLKSVEKLGSEIAQLKMEKIRELEELNVPTKYVSSLKRALLK